MTRTKTRILLAVATAVAAAAGGCTGGDAKPDPGRTVVDFSVADHALLDDVLAVDAKRSAGGFNFSYVPQTRPDGLTGLTANTVDATIVDGYRIAGGAQMFAEFAAQPTGTCDGIRGDPGSGVCVRQERLGVAADDPKMRNLTVYLPSPSPSAPSPAGGVAFWSAVKMVPASEAAWFTALVEKAKTAPKTRVG